LIKSAPAELLEHKFFRNPVSSRKEGDLIEEYFEVGGCDKHPETNERHKLEDADSLPEFLEPHA